MLQLGLLIAAMFAVQAFLSVLQMRHFSKEFIKLRRRGKVACGRQTGGFHAGAIVMFRIDEAIPQPPSPFQRVGRTLAGRT